MGVEGFTILAILEANDRISRVLETVDGSLDKFSSAAARAAETAAVAGERIDASLLQTASGADASQLASAKLSAAQSKVADTAKKQADAERAVIEAQTQVTAAEDGDTAATERLVAAMDALTSAQKRAALAAKEEAAAADHAAAVNRATVLSTAEGRAAADEAAAAQTRLAEQQARTAAGSSMLSKGLGMASLGIAAIGVISVKVAGDFESMTQHLVTDAGESQANIGMIRSGMLQLAVATGTTTTQMAAGMYHVESAGYHGADALKVMQVAAEGAKVGGADLDTVSKALTGTMNAYGMSGSQATSMMNQLITTVGQGDMKMQDLASSLGNVAPLAAAAGIKFSEVGGAIATMTAQNMSAAQATQDLAFTIRSLSNPLKPAQTEMAALGLSANGVTKELGSRGLVATLQTLTDALARHTKGGEVFTAALKNSQVAAQNAGIALKSLDPSIQGAAAAWQKGSITTAAFNKELAKLPPAQASLGRQFELLVKKSGSFNDLLKSGSPSAQSFTAALSKLMGGSTGLNTALMITGGRMDAFKGSAGKIAEAATISGKHVEDWDKIQTTFNQKMDTAKASVEAIGISIGTAFLPVVSKIATEVLRVVTPIAQWTEKHQKLMGYIASGLAAFLALAGAIKLVSIAMAILDVVMDANPIVLIGLAVVGLVAGFLYLWSHVQGFRDFWIGCWNVIKIAFGAVKDVVMMHVHAIVQVFNVLVAAGMWVWHQLQSSWNAITAAAATVWHFLESTWHAVADTTMAVWGAISDFFTKWWPLLLTIFGTPIAILMSIWNHLHQALFDTARSVWSAISGFFVGTWNLIKSGASAAWGLIKKYIIQPIEEVWAFLQPAIHQLQSFLANEWNGLKIIASAVWKAIKAAIINPISEAWHTLTSTVASITRTITSGLNSAWNAVSNIGSKFFSIGSSIVQGIINGVTGSAGSLYDTLKGLANNALNAAKSFLGINSPSRRAADEIGKWIPHGVAAGVVEHAHVAQAAVKAMAQGLAGQSVSVGLSAPVSSAGLSLGAGSAARGGGGVTYVTFDLRGSSVMSNGDMDLLVGKIGRALATKILPQGGVRIRA